MLVRETRGGRRVQVLTLLEYLPWSGTPNDQNPKTVGRVLIFPGRRDFRSFPFFNIFANAGRALRARPFSACNLPLLLQQNFKPMSSSTDDGTTSNELFGRQWTRLPKVFVFDVDYTLWP